MPKTLSDEFFNGFANAVDDIRSKFEQSVWGREVTETGPQQPRWPEAREQEPAQERDREPDLDR
jgi:hypothetical protein